MQVSLGEKHVPVVDRQFDFQGICSIIKVMASQNMEVESETAMKAHARLILILIR